MIGGAIRYGEKAAIAIKNVKEKGLSGAWEAVKEKRVKAVETPSGGNKTFDININGSLKLTGDNGQSIDIINELMYNNS